MRRTLSEIKVAKQNLHEFRGNEINRNYWRGVLADTYPKIIEEKDGLPVVIDFMGKRCTTNNL